MRRLKDIAVWLAIFCVGALLACALAYPALAHDPSMPNAGWYNSAQLTPSAQKRLGFAGCCHADDVVHTQFRVDKTAGTDEWYYLKNDRWEHIPPDIVHWGESAPDGQATLFALAHPFQGNPEGTLTCFYPPEGGI